MPPLTSAAAWPIEPPLVLVLVAAGLYVLGGRRSRSRSRRDTWRSVAFALGLLSLVVAVDSPFDALADSSFAAHMTQHVLLLTVAPPLLVVAAPWARIWRPLPLRFRRATARAIVVSPRTRYLRRAAHALAHPVVAWTLFNANLLVWHLPAAFDLTLRNETVHQVEHGLFFATGMLFWGAITDSAPFRARLPWLWRVAYLIGAMLVGWVLAVVLAFAQSPIYPAYAALAHHPGGIGPLVDQRLAAGVMWVPGSLSFTIAIVVFFYRWLTPAPQRARLGLAANR